MLYRHRRPETPPGRAVFQDLIEDFKQIKKAAQIPDLDGLFLKYNI